MSGFLSRPLRRFAASDRGAILPFTMSVLILLVMVGALAVNSVRFENERASMQATLDICVLNAAALKQTLDERTVFFDCVEKNGIPSEAVSNFTVQEGYSSKSVTAQAEVVMPKFFLHRSDPKQETWSVGGASAAQERVGNVEVSLVLDVSGSMLGTRITSLRTAAKEFVTTLLTDDVDNRVSITLVPYNGQVNLGPDLMAKFNVTDIPTNPSNNPDVRQSRCVDLPASVYSSGTAMSRTLAMPATAYSDTFSTTNQTTGFVAWNDPNAATLSTANVWCPNSAANQVRLPDFTAAGQQGSVDTPQERIQQLHNRIDALTAVGATSINAGMRWGLAFLDPAARSIFDEFAAAGRMPTAFRDRPLSFNDPDVMKVVVLMSDGEHFAEERVNAGFRSGMSPIWRGTDGNYSIFHANAPTTNRFWVPHLGTWRATAWVNSSNSGTATQQTWPQVLQTFRATYVAWQFYARALGTTSSTRTTQYNNALNAIRTQTPTGTMDSQLQSVCNRARDLNVVTFTIAFEAPTNGQTQLRACASTPARYYVASTTTIRQVFASIAGNISKLRLTQ